MVVHDLQWCQLYSKLWQVHASTITKSIGAICSIRENSQEAGKAHWLHHQDHNVNGSNISSFIPSRMNDVGGNDFVVLMLESSGFVPLLEDFYRSCYVACFHCSFCKKLR
jgi:hypothetical protein